MLVFTKTGMIPPVLETGVFSQDGVQSMKNQRKTAGFSEKLYNLTNYQHAG